MAVPEQLSLPYLKSHEIDTLPAWLVDEHCDHFSCSTHDGSSNDSSSEDNDISHNHSLSQSQRQSLNVVGEAGDTKTTPAVDKSNNSSHNCNPFALAEISNTSSSISISCYNNRKCINHHTLTTSTVKNTEGSYSNCSASQEPDKNQGQRQNLTQSQRPRSNFTNNNSSSTLFTNQNMQINNNNNSQTNDNNNAFGRNNNSFTNFNNNNNKISAFGTGTETGTGVGIGRNSVKNATNTSGAFQSSSTNFNFNSNSFSTVQIPYLHPNMSTNAGVINRHSSHLSNLNLGSSFGNSNSNNSNSNNSSGYLAADPIRDTGNMNMNMNLNMNENGNGNGNALGLDFCGQTEFNLGVSNSNSGRDGNHTRTHRNEGEIGHSPSVASAMKRVYGVLREISRQSQSTETEFKQNYQRLCEGLSNMSADAPQNETLLLQFLAVCNVYQKRSNSKQLKVKNNIAKRTNHLLQIICDKSQFLLSMKNFDIVV